MAAKHTNPLAVRRMSQSNNPDVRAAALSEMEKMEGFEIGEIYVFV